MKPFDLSQFRASLLTGTLTANVGVASPYLNVGGAGGDNGVFLGNGDGASYTTYDIAMHIWFGLGMKTFDGSVNGYYDARAGVWDTKGGFKHNGQPVWSQINDGAGSGCDADLLDGQHGAYYQPALGFTPVQQGGGTGQLTNKVYIGWSGSALKCTVDTTDEGPFVFDVGAGHTWLGGQTAPYLHSTGNIDIDGFVNCATFHNNPTFTGNVNVNGTLTCPTYVATGSGAMFQWQNRDDSSQTWGWYSTAGMCRLWHNTQGDLLRCDNTTLSPGMGDGGLNLGASGLRWNSVWCFSSAMQTSDMREKNWRGPLNALELAVAADLIDEIGIYQWLRDGDDAKLQCGFGAQNVIAVFDKHGLDWKQYGFISFDVWPDKVDTDQEGNETVVPGGNRFSIMFADLIAFTLAAQKQRQDSLEARIAALEAKP